jgi:hypothetical protein
MENQVTSIEQSKRLIEMGVPAEKASMIYQSHFTQGVPKLYAQPYQRNGYPPKEKIREDVVPAFTVADLLGVMPPDIPAVVGQNHDYALTLSNNFCWNLRYENSHTHQCIGEQLEFDLVDLLCNRIEWIVSNGYELNL